MKNGRLVLSRSDVNSFKGQLGDPYTHKEQHSIHMVSSEIDEFGSTTSSLVSENVFLDIRSGKNRPAQYSWYSWIMLRAALVISRFCESWIHEYDSISLHGKIYDHYSRRLIYLQRENLQVYRDVGAL